MYRKILVPTDGSDCAGAGLEHAIKLAQQCGASLRLLTVIDLATVAADWAGAEAWQTLLSSLREHSRGVLEAAQRRASEAGLACESEAVELPAGRVADAIVTAASDCGCDLIVMGSHGRRGVSRVLLGSDAELVLRSSRVPVLVVPAAK
jgi:nucleotide-binding universal stress UspA family protein